MNKYIRLTERSGNGIAIKDTSTNDNMSIWNAIERLAELENKIENKTLIELPCKVGDIVYEVIKGLPIQEWKIESICFDKVYPTGVIWAKRTSDFAHWKFWCEDFGKTLFRTEAEAKLRALDEKPNFTNHTSDPNWN